MKELASDTIYGCFEETVKRFPDKLALVYLGTKWTYSELKEASDRFAAALHKLGVRRGDKAVLYLPNIPQWLIAFLALQRLGAAAVAVAPIYTPIDLKYMVNDSEAETLICADTNFGYALEVLPETELKRVIVTTMMELLPWWKRLIGKGFDRVPEGSYTLGENVYSFKKLLHQAPSPSELPSLGSEGEDMTLMLYTGGTTGLPKGVPYTNLSFLENALIHRKISEALVPLGEGIVLQGGPLYHNLGVTYALVTLCLVGETLILTPRVNLDAYFDLTQRYKVTNFFGVPALFRMILDHDRVDYYDLSSFQYVFTGGDVLPTETAKRWQKKLGVPLYQAFGITETCGGVTICPPGDIPEGSCGKITPGKKVKFVDSDSLEPLPPEEGGELLVSSDHMVRNYWNKPEETAECFVEIEGQLWYRTGDIMRLDKDGWFFFLDRTADVIKHRGYRIAASEIDRVLQEHPAVVAASTVGVPDPKVGERIKAFVVLREDVKGISSYELTSWCRQRLAPYKVPQWIEFRDYLPRSKVGKFLRRELRAEERRKLEKIY